MKPTLWASALVFTSLVCACSSGGSGANDPESSAGVPNRGGAGNGGVGGSGNAQPAGGAGTLSQAGRAAQAGAAAGNGGASTEPGAVGGTAGHSSIGGTGTGGTGTGGTGTSGTGTSGTGTGGAAAGMPGSAGGPTACSSPPGSTATRPQLSSTAAADDTPLKYFARHGTLGALATDNWNPTAGLGSAATFTPTTTVAADGSGSYKTVQAAINAASGTARQFILVKPGTYRELISIANNKPPITLYGADSDATKVVIVNDQTASSAGGTAQSATFSAKANGLSLLNLSISNDFASPNATSQAVALYTTGDTTVLENVRLHGFQDTLYIDSSGPTVVARVYIKNSFIEGDTDFIFGRATAVIEGSTLNYLSSRKGSGSGVYLAPSTVVANDYGFLLIGCSFTADATAPANKISLGRSWDQGGVTPTPNGQAVIRESMLGAHISKTAPWAAAATSGRAYSATGNRFFEYCNSGPSAH